MFDFDYCKDGQYEPKLKLQLYPTPTTDLEKHQPFTRAEPEMHNQMGLPMTICNTTPDANIQWLGGGKCCSTPAKENQTNEPIIDVITA